MAIKFNGNNISAHSTFKAATASAAGGSGLVPAPAAGENTEYLRGDGTWAVPVSGLFKTENVTFSDTLSAGMAAERILTLLGPYTTDIPEYIPIAIVQVDIGNDAVLKGFGIKTVGLNGRSFSVKFANTGTAEITINGTITILWAKYGSI